MDKRCQLCRGKTGEKCNKPGNDKGQDNCRPGNAGRDTDEDKDPRPDDRPDPDPRCSPEP